MADRSTIHGLIDEALAFSVRTSAPIRIPGLPVDAVAMLPQTLILDGLMLGMLLARHQPDYVRAILDDVWGGSAATAEDLEKLVAKAEDGATAYRRASNAPNN